MTRLQSYSKDTESRKLRNRNVTTLTPPAVSKHLNNPDSLTFTQAAKEQSNGEEPKIRELRSRVVSILLAPVPRVSRKESNPAIGPKTVKSELSANNQSKREEPEVRKLRTRVLIVSPSEMPLEKTDPENNPKPEIAAQIVNEVPYAESKTRGLRSSSRPRLPEQIATRDLDTGSQSRVLRSRTAKLSSIATPTSCEKLKLKKNEQVLSKRVTKQKSRSEKTEIRSGSRSTPVVAKRKASRRPEAWSEKRTLRRRTSAQLSKETPVSRKESKSQDKSTKKPEKKVTTAKTECGSVSANKRSDPQRSVTVASRNKLAVTRNTNNRGALKEKNTSVCEDSSKSVMHYETLHKQRLPSMTVVDGAMEQYGRGAFKKQIDGDVGDVPVYIREKNCTVYGRIVQTGFKAEEIVPCNNLTPEQVKILEAEGFELATMEIPDKPTPTQQFAARDAMAQCASKRRKRKY